MESATPNFFVKDIQATIQFYTKLGFAVVNAVPNEQEAIWVMMQAGGVTMMFQNYESLGDELPQIPREPGCSMLSYIKVTQIRKLRDELPAEAIILKDLNKTFYGATEFSIADNNGYVLTFAEDEPA
jgi:catechol 2,3-dioxygenase-like lactoylglutathione lyase family enzyme